MPRANCRCGQTLDVPESGDDRVVCPSCGAKVRVRRRAPLQGDPDGFIRFNCPCGRRLKVSTNGPTRPTQGKCPDCGRVVPVPETNSAAPSPSDPEAQTQELSAEEKGRLDAWIARHASGKGGGTAPSPARTEAGFRVCPGCGQPVHLGASTCRECGIPVPKR